MFKLLLSRRFLPLFITQFLGAANDNLFKNAMVILVIYQLGERAGLSPAVLATIAIALLIAPSFIVGAIAGQVADRFEKSRLIRAIKLAEIGIAAIGAWSLLSQNVYMMLFVLMMLGIQSTFFGPVKYAILPEHLTDDELIGASALIEGGTFAAILVGTLAGGLLILLSHGDWIVSASLLALAIAGYLSALAIPRGHPGKTDVRVSAHILRDTVEVLALVRQRRDVFLSVLGISWFWLTGATFLSQFPAFAKTVLHADQTMVTLMLTVFSVGVAMGSMVCSRLLKGEISARYVPFAILGLTLFCFDLYGASHGVAIGPDLAGPAIFLRSLAIWHVLADLLLIALCGGIYIVPLYAILQSRTEEATRARTVAANNIMNSAFMVASALVSAVLLAFGVSVTGIFLVIAVANFGVAIYICRLLPDAVLKGIFVWVLRLVYRVRVEGAENFKLAGDRVVIVVNHVSYLDAVLMAAFLPSKPTFAIDTMQAKKWWVKPFLKIIDAFPMDPTNPMSTKSLIRVVKDGNTCVIFPEGRLTVTGSLMKVYEGPGMIADKAAAMLLPVRIDGAQFTPFSYLKGKVPIRWFPRITITILPPCHFDIAQDLKGRQRRQQISIALYDVMSRMMFETTNHNRTLFTALLDAQKLYGAKTTVVDDITRKPLTYSKLILGSLILGRRLAKISQPGEVVGIMLPNVAAAPVAFFGLQAFTRLPAMLNFSTGANNLVAAVTAAQIRTVITSRRFIEQARLDSLVDALQKNTKILYLEDVRESLTLNDKLRGLVTRPFARTLHKRFRPSAQSAATVLFTSGSEGTPKGVVLSHINILSNCHQLGARVAFSPADVVFNALPVFHSFGLTAGLLLPVLSGIKTFLYPSPLHYRIVPELAYSTNATVFFGTDTFLAGYARVASPYDFYSVRYVFAGAEKVKDETRRIWMEKFGLRILEGYGTTETSPVLAINTPMHHAAGTVGRLLPGIEHRLQPVPGIEEGGRLFVRGPNVMKGYLRAEKPGILEPPAEGWYDTGDIVTIDSYGYMRIAGRAKRFAKIAGEMVSLGRVEAELSALWPSSQHAAVAIADERKGEQIVLITTQADADRAAIQAQFRSHGLSDLYMPKTIRVIDCLPLLGTGKVDYVTAKALAEGKQ